MKKLILSLSLTVSLLMVAVLPALAQEATTITGTVQTVDPVANTFTVLTAEGTTLTVVAPLGSDLTMLVAGDTVEVSGSLAEDGTFAATGFTIVAEDELGGNSGFYCSNPDVSHPALGAVAEAYDSDYSAALDLFCAGGLGVGGVALTLATSQAAGLSPEEIATMRETMGWGQIWKALAQASDDDGEVSEASESHGNPNAPGQNKDNHGGGNSGGNGKGHGNGQGNGRGHSDGDDD